ncbi:MAG: trypsin-like peptidase domain-containing protein [Leptolyngbyaceae cyanobacterium SL_5_14]|nr:trypsin-like peptidase domain-containing protein [Leptolyngbyaceae cyanobacterium SL_5_14]
MSQLEHLLQQCTVKLTLPGQSGWGTGFFVAPGLILTCAHVVRKATDLQVTVFYSARQDPLSSIVKAKADDGKTLDLALVELSEPLFDHPCVFLDEEPVAIGQALYSYGYLKSYTNAAPVRPVNEGLTGNTPPLLKLQGAQIENGISGAALLNLKTGKICGMVKETRAAGFDLGGGAIPTRVVLEQFPQLRELQREFHQQDQQWTNLLKPTETLSPSSRSVTVEDDANSPIVTGDSNLVSSSNVVQQGKYNINASTMSGIHIGDVIHPSHPQTDRKQTIKKILMLSANPENPEVSRRRKEIKEIRGALGRAKHKNLFDLQDRSDIGAAELSEELLTIEPFVVDISGQESGIESLVLENIFNDATSKSSERLIARLFEFHNENIKCIILNKCYSEKQAKAIVQHIEFVVGISQSLKDNDTLDFLKTFYVHLGSERTVEDSYEAGRLSLEKRELTMLIFPYCLKSVMN